jgi:hypothetical protein
MTIGGASIVIGNMRPSGIATELEARRLRAVEYFQERKPLVEIASRLGVDLSSVKR